jgi:hypothetical protein
MGIEQVLQNNRAAVGMLLRNYRVVGPVNMDTIRRAHNRHGENFMLKLLEILVPDTDSFSTIITPETSAVISQAINTNPSTAAQLEQIQAEAQTKGKFWSFWDNLLNRIGNTGETIGKFKEDTQSTVNRQEYLGYEIAQRNRSQVIFALAGVLVFVILLILLFRK